MTNQTLGRLSAAVAAAACALTFAACGATSSAAPAEPKPSLAETAAAATQPPAPETTTAPAAPTVIASETESAIEAPVGADSALAVLAALSVKGRAPMTGYDRDRFGAAWLDADRNGCDQRNDMLTRDLTAVVYELGTHDCVVTSGDLADPYTGTTIHFVKGDGTLVDIDHVVALGNAWVTGAFNWPIKKRAAIATDPLNLLPVDASANRQKGDGDAATWLPSNKSYRCQYVARQIAVKAKFGLWVTSPEKAVMEQVLAGCPGQATLADSGYPVEVPLNITDPGADDIGSSGSGSVDSSSDSSSLSSATVYYENCDAVRAAGAAPIYRGDPGYDSHLDGDGDGVACE